MQFRRNAVPGRLREHVHVCRIDQQAERSRHDSAALRPVDPGNDLLSGDQLILGDT